MNALHGLGYEIGRPTGVCAATGAPLAPGDAIVVALVEREDGAGVERLDFAADAWTPAAVRGRRQVAHWRTRQPEPNARPKPFVDDDTLLDLFDGLTDAGEEGGDPGRARSVFRFVLALILLRKRLLVQDPSPAGEPGVMLVRRRTRADEPPAPRRRIPDPGIDDETAALAMEQLSVALRGEP